MHDRILRIGLWLLALPAVTLGIWAGFAPRSFYTDFPRFGRSWIAPDGPFNEHLVRDVGALNAALAIVTIAAAVTLGPALVRAVLGAWLVEGVMHLVYHARHLDPFGSSDQVAIIVSLVFVPLLAAVLLVADRRATRAG